MSAVRRPWRGFTLIETVICAAIIAGLGVALLASMGHATRAAQVARERDTTNAIAAMVLADIFSTPHVDPAGNPLAVDNITNLGATIFGPIRPVPPRKDVIRVSDYQGRIESPPQDRDGNALADLAGWVYRVDIQHVDPVTLAADVTHTGLVRVTVNVAYGSQLMDTRVIYRATAWDDFVPTAEAMP